MSGGIEDTIFQNIESGSGETFDPSDTYEPGGSSEPTRRETNREPSDPEGDQLDSQLRSRARPQEDELPRVDQRKTPDGKKPDQRREPDQAKATDEFGNPIGSNSFHVTRRLKSQLDNQRSVNQTLRGQVEELTRRVAEREVLEGLPQRLGLSSEDMKEVMSLAALIKGNPVDGARRAIEVALAKGANLRDIVNDEFVPNLNLNAVRALIDSRLPEPKQQPEVDVDTRAQEAEARQFLADYPEAELHGDVVAHQMQKIQQEYDLRNVKVSKYVVAEQAFKRIEDFCRNNQLDITQPLGPQLQARRAPSGDNTPRRQSSPRPMPNGSNGGGELQSRRSSQASSDDSFGSIVREAMLEQGYQLN